MLAANGYDQAGVEMDALNRRENKSCIYAAGLFRPIARP
jgi:hypothetical protein